MHEEDSAIMIESETNPHNVRPPTPGFSFRQYRMMTPKDVRSSAFAGNRRIMKSNKESDTQSVILSAGPAFLTDVKTTISEDQMQVFLRTTPMMSSAPKTPYLLRPYHQPLPSIGQQRLPEEDEISIVDGSDSHDTPPPSYGSATTKPSNWMDQSSQDKSKEDDPKDPNSEGDSAKEPDHEQIHKANSKEARPESAKSAKLDPDDKTDNDVDDQSDEINWAETVKQMASEDIDVRLTATTKARKKMSQVANPDMDEMMEAGIVEPAVQSLKINNTDLQYEALWVLTNITAGKSEDTETVVGKGSVPLIVGLLKSPEERIREQAIWALGNMAGDDYKYRKMILDEHPLETLVEMLNGENSLSLLRNASWMLCNLTRHKPVDHSSEDLDLIMRALKILLDNSCQNIQGDALWTMSYITDGTQESIQVVIDHGMCPKIVELMKSEAKTISKPALRVCGNIATGTDTQTDAILNENTLEVIKPLLENGHNSVKREICWFLSNVTAGTQEQIQKVIDAGWLERLVDAVSDGFFDVTKEAIWALSNFSTGASPSQIMALMKAGGIKALLSVLERNVGGQLLQVSLEGIGNILDTCSGRGEEYETVKENILENDGMSLLETHSSSQFEVVSQMVENILIKHFDEVSEYAASTASSVGENEEEREVEKEEEKKEEEETVEKVEDEQEKEENEEHNPEEGENSATTEVEDRDKTSSGNLSDHALKYTK